MTSDEKLRAESAYRLAMMGLQSDRYLGDPSYRDAVDDVLAWSQREALAATQEGDK